MSYVQTLVGALFAFSVILLFANFSPADELNTWIYYAVLAMLTGSGYLVAVIFGQHNTFVYDPSPDNWRRRTDPRT
jgi:hypothetical protein